MMKNEDIVRTYRIAHKMSIVGFDNDFIIKCVKLSEIYDLVFIYLKLWDEDHEIKGESYLRLVDTVKLYSSATPEGIRYLELDLEQRPKRF